MNDFVICKWYTTGAQASIDEQQHIIMVFHNENWYIFKFMALHILDDYE